MTSCHSVTSLEAVAYFTALSGGIGANEGKGGAELVGGGFTMGSPGNIERIIQ